MARVDDSLLPAGVYQLRATARDRASNLNTTDRRGDGQPMTLTLPLRVSTAVNAGVVSERIVQQSDQARRKAAKGSATCRDPSPAGSRQVRRTGGHQRPAPEPRRSTDSWRTTGGLLAQHRRTRASGRRGHHGRRGQIHIPGDSRRNTHPAFRLPGDSVDAALTDRGQPDHVGSVIRSCHATPPEERPKRSLLGNASLVARSSGRQARGASGRALRTLADLQDHTHGARRLVDSPIRIPAHLRRGPLSVPGPPSRRSGLCVPNRAHEGSLRSGSGAAVLMSRDTNISLEAPECETPPRRRGYPEDSPTKASERVIEAIKQRLTYANVMATIAVFIALGGSSYAALSITGRDVQNSSLTYRDLKRNTLGGSRIKESSLGRVPQGQERCEAERGVCGSASSSGVRADTIPVYDVCVETSLRGPAPYTAAAHRLRGSGAPRYARSSAAESR